MDFMFLVLILVLNSSALAQDDLLKRPDVRAALDYLQANHERHLAKQVEIAEIPAPTFHEGERALLMAAEFRRAGLKNVEIDKQGNALGWRPGRSQDAMVLAAHLDISFPVGVNTKVRKEGNRWHAPGLADDSRGLAALLAIAEAMEHGKVQTEQTLLFVANVGEEGLGDLIGVKYLFRESPHKDKLKSFISIDGTNPSRVVNGGSGVKRYRISIKGAGGHSYGNFGRPNAIHAAGRMIGRFAAIEVPTSPKTTYNVGNIKGGTMVNAIAEECTFEIDMRSESPAELDKLELKMLEAVRLAVEEENKFRAASGQKVTVENKLVGQRPAGRTPESNSLVQAAQWASRATGHTPRLTFSSTDSNFPISLGIPAVTLGGGGRSDNAHSLNEWFEPAEAWKGPQTVLLTVLAYERSLK
jgi:acetylornithine deacetylase/succinyl-diaminopimelate desuccinylase-like protein